MPDLRQHFERPGYVTNRIDDDTIDVWRGDVADEPRTRSDVEGHLAVWRAMHPGAVAELLH